MVVVEQADGVRLGGKGWLGGVGGGRGDGGGGHILWSLYLEPNAVPHVQQTCSLDHKCQSALKGTWREEVLWAVLLSRNGMNFRHAAAFHSVSGPL